MTLVDSNVLIDVLTSDRNWVAWSLSSLQRCASAGRLVINEIIYTEMSIHMADRATLDAAVESLDVRLDRTPREALFLAGKAFHRYRQAGGARTGVLPDFFIGAHAQTLGIPLLTRDLRRYRTYFPELRLIAP